MAFNAANFIPLSSMANSNSGRVWSYTTTDTTATVVTSGYFDAAGETYGLKNADIILCYQSNGTDFYEVVDTSGVFTIGKTVAFA